MSVSLLSRFGLLGPTAARLVYPILMAQFGLAFGLVPLLQSYVAGKYNIVFTLAMVAIKCMPADQSTASGNCMTVCTDRNSVPKTLCETPGCPSRIEFCVSEVKKGIWHCCIDELAL